MLRAIYKLERENNEMLRKLRRGQKSARIFRILYWIIFLGSILGAYYFIEPYLQQFGSLYSDSAKIFNSFGTMNGLPTMENFEKLLESQNPPAATTVE